MRFESFIRLSFSLFQVWVSSRCLAQTTGSMRRVLLLHNFFRRHTAQQHNVANMNQLSWSEELAARAEGLIRCSSWRNRRRNSLGPNVNVGKFQPSVSLHLDRLLTNWYSQRDFFSHSAEFYGCSPWHNCSEYRTMVNAKQHSVGCAVLPNCGRRRNYSVLLCVYEGGLPDEAEFDFLWGASCTKCGNSLAFCHEGLCASCHHTDSHLCDCRKTCNREGIGRGHLNSSSCTCDCEYGLGPNCDEPCRNPPNLLGEDMCRTLENRGPGIRHDPVLGPISPFDCQRFGHMCPEQCLCTPWPGTESLVTYPPISEADLTESDQRNEINYYTLEYEDEDPLPM